MIPGQTVEQRRTFLCSPATIKDVRKWVADVLSENNVGTAFVDDVVLAVSEAVTNSVLHGYESTHEGIVDVRLFFSGNALHLVVRDYGISIAKNGYAAPDLETPHEGGYGLFLIQALTDSVTAVPLEQGNEIHMVKKLQ